MSSIKFVGIDRLAQLNALHLYGMATAWSELLAEGPRRPVQPEAWLDRLGGNAAAAGADPATGERRVYGDRA